MLKTKPILTFAGLSIAIYIVLLLGVSYTGIGDSFSQTFPKIGEGIFGSFKQQGKVEFQSYPQQSREGFDIHIVLMNKWQIDQAKEKARKSGQKTIDVNAATYDLNSWRYAMIPGLFVLALILASPLGWKRKGIALLLGILLFSLFILFRLRMDIAFYFHAKPSLDVVHPGELGKAFLEGFHKVFSQGFSMVMAIFIWVLVVIPYSTKTKPAQ